MDESKLTKEQIEKIQTKINKNKKSNFAKKQNKEEMLNEFKKKLGLL